MAFGRSGQPAPVRELLHDPGDRAGVGREPAQALVVGPTARGDPDPLADDEAQVHHHVALGDVLVDLAVGEPRQGGLVRHDQRLGLGGTFLLGEGDGGLGELQRIACAVIDHRDDHRAYHLPTPTWTFRKRAPGTAWPTWPTWPGSPLPQLGVPSIT